MCAESEAVLTDDEFVDALSLRCAGFRSGDGLPMSDAEERRLFKATVNTAMAAARDENRRPRARVQYLQGAAELYASLGDLEKAIEVLTWANEILPTVMVRKRRAEIYEEMTAIKHAEQLAAERPWAPAPRRRR
jgi:hypothetical protein